MPSQYSTDLRIELIANGEQSGTWGTTTNTNLGTIIEDAISGAVTVSVISANQALTASNGSADQARCAAIILTTTTTDNFAVYVPPTADKLYVVYNNTSYVASVYCSTVINNTTAAGSRVAIPAGKKVLLRSDGTDITEQLNHVVGSFSTDGSINVARTAYIGASTVFGGDAAVRGRLTVREPLFSYSSAFLGYTTPKTVAQSSAINTTNETITLAAASFTDGTAVMLTSSDTMPTGLSTNTLYYVVNTSASSYFSGTGYINDGAGSGSTTEGTILTITAINAGSIGVGTVIDGPNVLAGTTVTSLGTGTGGAGTYNIGTSQYTPNTTITGTYAGSQTIKLSTTLNGSAVNITAVGTGDLTLTPVSTANTPPEGSSTTAIATADFVNTAITAAVVDNQVLESVRAATRVAITLSGTQTIDGVAVVAGDRVLVKNQLTSSQTPTFYSASSQTATFTTASPTVITVATAPNSGTPVTFTTTGTLPTGISATTTYFVNKINTTTFNISTSPTLSPLVNVTGAGSGTHTMEVNQSVITVASAPAADSQVMFTNTGGSLLTGLSEYRIYYVVDRTATTFSVALAQDGEAVSLSGTASGTSLVGNVPSSANGIYVVNASTWTRATDANTSAKIAAAQVAVTEGSTNGGEQYVTNFKSTDTLGTTTMQWQRTVNGPASTTVLGGIRVAVSGTTLNLYTYES